MSRVEAASGANYSSQAEAPRRYEPIGPVGTNYTPIGKPDIAAMRRGGAPGPSPSVSAAKPPPPPSAPRPTPVASSPSPSPNKFAAVSKAPTDAWPEEAPTVSTYPSPPAASNAPVVNTPRPLASVGYVLCDPSRVVSDGCSRPLRALYLRHPLQHRRNLKTTIRLARWGRIIRLSSCNLRNWSIHSLREKHKHRLRIRR